VKQLLLFFLLSCSTYEQFQKLSSESEIPSRNYPATFEEVWSASVGVMRNYDIETQNQEIGLIKTRWMENTVDLNFSDSFGTQDKIKSARFKILLNVSKYSHTSNNRSKVTIIKRQLVENDYLQGWKEIKNDKTLEKTLLYRIERIIKVDRRLKAIQKEKEAAQLKEFEEN